MISLLFVFSLSSIEGPIPGCEETFQGLEEGGYSITRTIEPGQFLCFMGSVLIKADKNFVATYAFKSNSDGTTSEIKTAENPFLIGSLTSKAFIKFAAKDSSEKLVISLTCVKPSEQTNTQFFGGVFTTMKSFKKSISISYQRTLAIVAINEVPLSITAPVSQSLTKTLTVNGHSTTTEKSGNAIYLSLTPNYKDQSFYSKSEKVTIECSQILMPKKMNNTLIISVKIFSIFSHQKVPTAVIKLFNIHKLI